MSVIVVILLRNIYTTRVGRAWVALREDEVAAAATGINTTSTKLLAFAIGASVSGLAGAFYGSLVTIVSPDDFSFSISIAVLSIIVLGGIGNIAGVILGSFVLTFVIFWALPHMNEWSTTVSQTFNVPALAGIDFSSYTYIVYGVALILMMLFRPGGLLPSRARRIELQTRREVGVAGRGPGPRLRWRCSRSATSPSDSAACSAVSDVSFTVGDREILSMIGPNGAGKTTAFNCVTGLFPITVGRHHASTAPASSGWRLTASPRSASRAPSRTSGSSRS